MQTPAHAHTRALRQPRLCYRLLTYTAPASSQHARERTPNLPCGIARISMTLDDQSEELEALSSMNTSAPWKQPPFGPPSGAAPARRVHESGLHITRHIWALRPTAWHNQNPAYWQPRSVRSPSTHATATDSGSSAATPICSIPQISTTMLNDPASIHISNTSCAPTQALLREGT